ncbi:MAG: hypothetical protein DMD39_06680 [Gemmatimonadetes bacterium]|nr:MAG: hypothetical protein DMD39_06680 [Gemmatimonadota bacterium]
MELDVSPSNAGDATGAKTAKDPTAAASLAINVSRSRAIAFPAAAAISDLIAELSGALEELSCEETSGPAGLSPLQAIARIRTPAKVMKLNERLGIGTPLLRIDG